MAEAGWLDVEVEGEGEHALVKVANRFEYVELLWLWIGNMGDGEARVGLRWSGEGKVWWNTVIPYLGNVTFNPPRPRVGPSGNNLILRVVGENVRLCVSALASVRV